MILSQIDWCIVAIILISSVISLWRGFIKEILSLLTWIAAVIVAWLFGGSFSTYLSSSIEAEWLRIIVACLILFILTLVVGAFVNFIFARLVQMTGLSGTDRLLGIVFGAARGGLVIVVLVGLFSNSPVRNSQWWDDSTLIPYFVRIADWSKNMVLGGDKQWSMQDLSPQPLDLGIPKSSK